MRRWMYFALLMIFILPQSGLCQTNPEKACRLQDGRLIFTLDNRWTVKQKEQVVKLFDLDSELVARALKGEITPVAKEASWSLKKIDASRWELSKPLKSADGGRAGQKEITLLDDKWITPSGVTERESVPYGINRFTRFDVFSYREGIARFFLPDKHDARQVILSGSFNGWSTTRAPMQKTDSGWIAMVRLKPGKYTYKYIIDGKWTPDPFNRQKENDLNGDFNSVAFCYNYSFYLRDYQGAQGVWVAGSFNGWNSTELRMQRVPGGWIRGMYLREGTHAYKFIVDRTWILDPANRVVRNDGDGNENSFVSIGDTFYFRLTGYPQAREVFVAGNFNAWNDKELAMTKIKAGWEIPYVLKPGNYEYKFIVDGTWIVDPSNPSTTGFGDYMNSLMVIKPNDVFIMEGNSAARDVIVSGSFNGWNIKDYRMVWRDGKWRFPLWLAPGKHTYKYIVDGNWILDPGNPLWEENEFGTGNSVLWIEP